MSVDDKWAENDFTKSESKPEDKWAENDFTKVREDLDKPVVTQVGYSEGNPNHKVDPFAQTGTLDTSDTGGGAQNDVTSVSPIFEIARAERLREAARALDPDDPTPSELVILPEGQVTVTGTTKTADEGRADVLREVAKLAENPVEIGGMNANQREAAKDTSSEQPDVDDEGHAVGPADERRAENSPVDTDRDPFQVRKPAVAGDDTVGHTEESHEAGSESQRGTGATDGTESGAGAASKSEDDEVSDDEESKTEEKPGDTPVTGAAARARARRNQQS
jgi:hypothetical protein